MTIEEYIESLGIELEEGAGYFTGDDFRTAIIGVSTDNRLVYSYDKTVEYYMQTNECDEESARDWIDYNTIRTVPYMGDYPPIIIHEVL